MADSPRIPAVWRVPLVSLGILLVAIVLLYRRTALAMVDIWSSSDTYAHGFVVPLISLWLIWRVRHQVLALHPKASPWVWGLLAGAAAMWLAGDLVAVNAVTQLALVLLIIISIPAVLGWAVAGAMAFPLGFLLFAVPIGDFMLPQLMEWTADFTVVALRWSGIPVYREGLQFVIPSGTWSVVEACSGIRYIIASLTVGCLFAYLSYRSYTKRLVFIGVSLLVPLVANWLRAYMIVMIGHLSGNELATGVDHLIYGWVFFGIVIMLMLMIGARWADAPTPEAMQTPGDFSAVPTVVSVGRLDRSVALSMLASLCIVGAPHGFSRMLALGTRTAPVHLVVPAAQGPWASAASAPSDWAPAFRNPSASVSAGFVGPGQAPVGVYLSYYRQQDYTRKLVSSENLWVSSKEAGWSRVSSGSASTMLAGRPLTVSSATLRQQQGSLTNDAPRLLAWRFYWVNGRFTASDVQAKVQGALSRLMGRGDDGAIVVFYTPLRSDLPEAEAQTAAEQLLQDFALRHGASLEAALHRTSGAV